MCLLTLSSVSLSHVQCWYKNFGSTLKHRLMFNQLIEPRLANYLSSDYFVTIFLSPHYLLITITMEKSHVRKYLMHVLKIMLLSKKKLKDVCCTRWTEQITGLDDFQQLFIPNVFCLKQMSLNVGCICNQDLFIILQIVDFLWLYFSVLSYQACSWFNSSSNRITARPSNRCGRFITSYWISKKSHYS